MQPHLVSGRMCHGKTSFVYRALLAREMTGVVIGGGVVRGAAGANPYIALSVVLGRLVLHLTVRTSIYGSIRRITRFGKERG